MNREKQIEEMARLMCEGCADYGDCKYDICDMILCEANRLYNAGYRKQSETANEIFADIEEISGIYATPFNTYITMREQKYNELKKKHIEREKI